jgi:type I restriction enzyme S subunit
LSKNQGILSDICSYSKAKVAVSELNTNTYFSTENMLPGKAGSIEATSLPAMTRTTACHKGDTLISNIRPYFKKIVYCEDVCGCSSDVLCFTPVQFQYAAYLFSTLHTDKFFTFMVAGSKGTKMPRGDKQQIMTYPLILPSEKELEEFNAVAVLVLEQLNYNRTENKRLSALRDALLPKLMSGELDVSALDF